MMHNRVFNMASGPVELTRATDLALVGQFAMAHHPSFKEMEMRLRRNLASLLGTKGDVVITHGSIRTGMDMAVANLVQPGDRVLVLANGYWGKLFVEMIRAYRGEPILVEFDPQQPITEQDTEAALSKHPDVTMVTMTDVETNTGIRNDAPGVGRVVKRHGALFVLDTACSAGNMPVESDKWGVDVGITGSQKGFCAAAGLAILTISPDAREWIRNRREPVYSWYHDLRFHWNDPDIEQIIKSGEHSPFSPASLLYFSLAASLDEIMEVGPEIFFERHRQAALAMRKGFRAAGLKLVIDDDQVASTTVVATWYPNGVEGAVFLKAMDERYDLFLSGNLGTLFAGKSFRLGLMSPPQIQFRQALSTITSVVGALNEQGSDLDIAAAITAAEQSFGGGNI